MHWYLDNTLCVIVVRMLNFNTIKERTKSNNVGSQDLIIEILKHRPRVDILLFNKKIS